MPDSDWTQRQTPADRWQQPPTAEELRAAFTKKRRQTDNAERRSEFAERFSNESLFMKADEDPPPREERSTQDGRPNDYYYDPADPYAVLGLEPDATWDDVVAAHRALAKAHHPDRLLAATDEERVRSEERIRDANVAYSILRRRINP